MSITVMPVTPGFVAEVGDVELARPTAEELAEIEAAFWEYAVLIFPGQHLDDAQHLAFAAHFGELERPSGLGRGHMPLRVREEFADVSNVDHTGALLPADTRLRQHQAGNRLWHTDASFRHRPSLCSLLYAQEVPPWGGRTEFADQRAAYEALPEDLRASLAGKVAEHSIITSRRRVGMTEFEPEELERLKPVPQLLVRTLPQTGRRTLYVAAHAGRILGMPEGEGRALIDRLLAHATQPQFVYSHRWRPHDLVLWDNRCTLHRGTEYDDLRHRRVMQRATVLDVANSCEQEGVPIPGAA